ncbi:hypothetical protein MLD38_014572 [Melastoma candidum]|uniref:Uncharacterized protein n=1 Tax=Melastoma candidum TaxID=119954 RepID=A0ACB9REJ8_9MYRT|nr:hypothetical protein MLD38_014572 [Melastoma candidum]
MKRQMMCRTGLAVGNNRLQDFSVLMTPTATGLFDPSHETYTQKPKGESSFHIVTRKWLHSHLHASPISRNLKVSCYGGESEFDAGDYWRILIEDGGKTWRIRLQHVDASGYLQSLQEVPTHSLLGGQQEIMWRPRKTP